MEHHQTVARAHNGTPGWWATVWYFTNPLRKTIYLQI